MMKIQGAGMADSNTSGGVGGFGGGDATTRSLERQIAAAQKKLQEVSSDKNLSMEQKMERRKEINQQITDLENQLRAHQIEMRRESQQAKGTSMEDMLGGKRTDKSANDDKGVSIGISEEGMQAMISADTAMDRAQVQGQVKGRLEGQARILKSEIAQDKSRGADVEDKEKALADMEQRAMDAGGAQIKNLVQAGKQMSKVNSSPDEDESDLQKAAENEETDGKTEYTSVDVRL